MEIQGLSEEMDTDRLKVVMAKYYLIVINMIITIRMEDTTPR